MSKKTKSVYTSIIAMYLIISIVGCSIAWDSHPNSEFDSNDLIESVASRVDEQWDIIVPIIEEHEGEFQSRMSRSDASNGTQVVNSMLEEQNGADYLRFSHALFAGEDSSTLLELAENLIDEEQKIS